MTKTLIDSGCSLYGAVSSSFAYENNLQRIEIPKKTVSALNGETIATLEVACAHIHVGGHNRH